MIRKGKQVYQEEVAQRLEKLKSRLTVLEGKIDQATDEVQTRYNEQFQQIKSQYQQAKGKLERLNASDNGDWQQQQPDIDKTLDQIKEAIDTVTGKLSEQAEPENKQER